MRKSKFTEEQIAMALRQSEAGHSGLANSYTSSETLTH